MTFLSRLLATGFFVGYFPVAPGTAGSLLAVILYWFIPDSENINFLLPLILLFFIGVLAATQVEKESQEKDNQIIIVDEIVGMFVTVIFFEKQIIWLFVAFLLFRLFDILKPFPAKMAEHAPVGWGVMLDDVVAGIYAMISLRLIHFLWLSF